MLSVIVPAYREERNIAANLGRLTESLDLIGADYEVILVVDGSPDNTYQAALAADLNRVRVLGYTPNMGKGFALRYGFQHSQGELVTFIDADLDLHPKEIGVFLRLQDIYQCDVVVGSKRHPQSRTNYPRFRRFQSWVFQMLIRLLFDLNVTDTQTGLKLFRRPVLEAVLPRMQVEKFAFDLELFVVAHRVGFTSFIEAPILLNYQFTSTTNLWAVAHVLADIARIFWRLNVSHAYDHVERRLPPVTPLAR